MSFPLGSKVSDWTNPCEWNWEAGRPAYYNDPWHACATWIVGADGQWRLCDACAKLPRFRRFRVRIWSGHLKEKGA